MRAVADCHSRMYLSGIHRHKVIDSRSKHAGMAEVSHFLVNLQQPQRRGETPSENAKITLKKSEALDFKPLQRPALEFAFAQAVLDVLISFLIANWQFFVMYFKALKSKTHTPPRPG